MLARAQSRVMARALEQAHPGWQVSLVTVQTRGDRDQTTPLAAVGDPEFFSAELDEALLGGQVDFCVHSLKDLPLVRPAGLLRAALPPRENPRDVVLWRDDVPTRLVAGEALRLGSSSPRRETNVADFLAYGLPATPSPPRLDFSPIRGPVEVRLAKLQGPRTGSGDLDGLVLALAGLNRLWHDPAGRVALQPLLATLRWTVLPLSKCPTAAGQGVLALECRAEDRVTQKLLAALHAPETAALVAMEEVAVRNCPPAERSGLGVTAVQHGALGPVCFVRGRAGQNRVERLDWNRPPPPGPAIGFNGLDWQRACTRQPVEPGPQLQNLGPGAPVFVAYWHAVPAAGLPDKTRLWVSGVESWRRLAAQGLWVEGCGDHLGFGAVRPTLACPVLALPPLEDWTALTYRWAVPGWHGSGIGSVVATYDIQSPAAHPVLHNLRAKASQSTHFYWSSVEQFLALQDVLPSNAHHACGAGKTLQALRAAGLSPQPFPNGREWQRWLQ